MSSFTASEPVPLPPTPPDSPTAAAMNETLPGRVNAATRKQHMELNRLLMNRLPLALPPHSETPLLLSRGIVPFARIFILFEVEWELFTRHASIKSDSGSAHEQEVRNWLVSLRPDGLARTRRLKKDLKHLRTVAGGDIYNTPDLGEVWTGKMRALIRTKPHVLVAFAWVFYMAVFSGGRWIRQRLADGGPRFWTQDAGATVTENDDASALDMPGFSFLSFDGIQDGEDIKAQFKKHLSEAEHLLTQEEKEEVVQTAQQLFDRSLNLVTELDQMVRRQKISSWIPWAFVAASFLLMLAYGLGQIERFAGYVSS